MPKKKILTMAKVLNDIMAEIDEKFLARWKDSKKEQKRVTLMEEALDFANERAFKDFGMGQSSVSMEISKLVLIAKDCLEKQESNKE